VRADVLVVGGGIGGAVLAGLLGRAGKRVTVVERSLGPAGIGRPEILWPATVRVLEGLISPNRLREEAVLPLAGLDVRSRSKTLVSVTRETLRDAGVQPWSTDPDRTRELLLANGGFELLRGVEVVNVLEGGGRIAGVRAREVASGRVLEIEAALVVGDDGARSRVREACGIGLDARPFPLDFLCFGFERPPSLSSEVGHVWLDLFNSGGGVLGLIAFPLPKGRGAGVVPARSRILDGGDAWERFLSSDAALREVVGARRFPSDFTRVGRAFGHARRYGGRGAVLLGDAVHPVSPAGGQGANMSVADAVALAEALLRGAGDPLAEYERRRRPANERSLAVTRRVARFLSLPDALLPAWGVRLFLRGGGKRAGRLVRFLSGAFQDAAVS
jgi:2-polyprenyl-6-methoxyphenol hydroxylase-like FAD-dependent oxidoreductase